MECFTVSLFGHRDLYNLSELEEVLLPILRDLMKKKPYVNFLIGRNGNFDIFAASAIKRVQKEMGCERSELTLVLPYGVADIEYYSDYYDAITIPEGLFGAHPKSAIKLRNRWMVEASDLVLVCVERERGGAYEAMKYAAKLHKSLILLKKNGED